MAQGAIEIVVAREPDSIAVLEVVVLSVVGCAVVGLTRPGE